MRKATIPTQKRQLELFKDITRLVTTDGTTEIILLAALGQLLTELDYPAGQIYQLSPSGSDVWLYLEQGNGTKPVTQIPDLFGVDEVNIITDALRQEQVIYVPDVSAGPYSYYESTAGQSPQRAEVAIPLNFGREKLGVLRLESAAPHAFTPDDLTYLSGLASLLASTLRNNRKIDQLQDSIQEIKTLYQLQHHGKLEERQRGSDYAQATGYEYTRSTLIKTTDITTITAPDAGVTTARQDNDNQLLTAPIKLHGETIGVLGLEESADETNPWTDDDIRLLEEVSSQVALAIENARLLQQTQEQTNELSLLFEATRQLTETIQLDHIYNILSTQIMAYLNADRCNVLLLNPARTHFQLSLAKGRNERREPVTLADMRLAAIEDFPALQQMLKRPERVIQHLNDLGLDPHTRALMTKNPEKLVRTLTMFPLVVRSTLIGLLEVEHQQQRHKYTPNELQLAQAIISQVTVAIENAQLFEQTEVALKDTQKLYDISRKLVESTSIDDVYATVLDTVRSYNVDRVSISLLDAVRPGDDSVIIAASWDRDPNHWVPVGTRFSGSNFSLVKTFAKPPFHPLISQNLRNTDNQDERLDEAFRQYVVNELDAVTLFSAPMFLGPEYKGVLSIYTRTEHIYTPQETRVYQTLADQAIIAIENYRLLQTTRQERDRASLLYELGQSLNQTTSVGEVQNVVLHFVESLGATDGELYITDGDEFVSLASTIRRRQQLPRHELAALGTDNSLEAYVLAHQETLAISINDVPADIWPLRHVKYLDQIRSLVCIPFTSQRSTIQGVLSLYHDEPNGFNVDQVATFQAVAVQMATSLENAWLLRQTNIVLHETELLYNITRGFNAAQTVSDLLQVLAKNLIDPAIDTMSIGFIPGLDNSGVPLRLELKACWQKNRGEVFGSTQVLAASSFEFLQQFDPTAPVEIFYNQQSLITQANIDEALSGDRSLLAVPLSVGGNWLGMLLLGSQTEGYTFKVNTISQTATLASQAAVVLQNLQLVEETQQNLYYTEVLSHLGQNLLTAASRATIFDLTLAAIAVTEPDRGAAIFMVDQVESLLELELTAIWDNPGHDWPAMPVGTRLSATELELAPLLKTGRTIISGNGPEDERFVPALRQLLTVMQTKVMVIVPLWVSQQVNGFILVGNQSSTLFPTDTIRLYEDIGREASGALENRRLFEEAQHRAWQLQTAADISQAVSAYLDLDTLLSETVELIKTRFDFYHVSIFLVDDYQRYAVVQASTGDIGRQMLDMKHKLEVGGKSIVGAATGSAKPRIALDVGQDAIHFNNPLLPETRSEMALPLVAQGRVIGALDVQSTRRGAFGQTDVTILQSMANQLANAIEAARAYQESNQALAEVQKIHQHYLQEQWAGYLQEKETALGFQLTEDGQAAALTNAGSPLVAANGSNPGSPLVVPLSPYGQAVIGSVNLDVPPHSQPDGWDNELQTIVEAVASQAAQAIEAARLFEQTQAAHREAEALYEVGRILVTTENETEMFNTVLDKMLSTMGLNQGGVLFFDDDGETGRLYALYRNGQPVDNPNVVIPIAGNASYEKLIQTKRPVRIDDFATDPLVEKVRQHGISTSIASLLLVPIVINDQVVGTLGADAVGTPHHFTEREMSLAKAMADQLAITLQNRRLIKETQRRAALLQTSSDVGRVATSILDENVLMDQAVELIREGFGFEHTDIYLMDEAGRNAILHKGELLGIADKTPIGSRNVVGQAIAKRRSIMARATDEANAYLLTTPSGHHQSGIESQLAVPLQVGGVLIGALSVLSGSPAGFTQEEISTLETLAAQLAVAIQNARAFREQQDTAERLKEIDKLKTQFLANMSHELRTPLNSIIGFSRVIIKGIDGPLTEMQKTDLTSIHNSGQHLLGLINNILDLSKIEAGKMELNFEETEVEPIIKTVMSTAIALVKDKPVTLRQEVPEHLPKMWADPTRLRQIVLNLVSNACKFTEEGEVIARVFAEPGRVVFTVSDTGIGIPEEKLEHIFEEFTQVDASTTRKAGGTGLGLPISRHFVEMHHGEIWVQSRLGVGTTLGFFIPTSPPSPEPIPAHPTKLADHLPSHKRLVVAIDDDSGVIDLYRRFLEQRNYQVVGLSHGKNAVTRIKEIEPYAILLDIVIPEKDGWSIIKELKDDPFTKNIPVIICSIVSDKNRGFSLGAANYLTKPIVETELVDALKQLETHPDKEMRVLVVDDQADDVLLVRRILEAQPNYTIFEANNGQEGLELVATKNPNLIILDLNMPKMDGFAMIEALKQNEATRNIPIVIVSAQDLTPDEQAFLAGQVEVLLRKGLFSEKELLEDVNHALEQLGHEEKALI